MEKTEIKKYLKRAFWDVNYSGDQLYAILWNGGEAEGFMTRQRIYIRLLETYSWYKIMELVPQEQWMALTAPSILEKLRIEQLKNRYQHVAKLLRADSVSVAG